MFDVSAQNAALQVLEFAFISYLLTGGALLLLLTKGFKQSGENTLLKRLVALPFLPTFVFWVLILGCLSIPLYWLYPEKHRTTIDFEGTEEEKQKLLEYRAILSKKSLVRTLAEKLGLAQKADPPWPFAIRP